MSRAPVVLKLGGDALASPERIAAEALRVRRRAERGPVLAVVSARRGVTDHLLALVQRVRDAVGAPAAAARYPGAEAEADRAVSAGEVVASSLLALALAELGVAAVSLDAREAGVWSDGRFGGARIQRIAHQRLERLLARGIVPVITGFQGWHRGRVATLGRGGSDTSAVALATALGAERVVFVKDAPGLCTADPFLVPGARPIARAPHRFLTALTAAGARVVQADAAARAEEAGLTLEFCSLESDDALSLVSAGFDGRGLVALAIDPAEPGTEAVTVVVGDPATLSRRTESLRAALADAGVAVTGLEPAASGLRFLVPATSATIALRALHDALLPAGQRPDLVRRAS